MNVNFERITFAFMSHIVFRDSVLADPKEIEAAMDWYVPKISDGYSEFF